MKKIVKISLYSLLYLVIIFFLAIMFIATAKADLVKPNNGIEPYQVVKIQLRSLKKNDDPTKDNGIEQTWEFAHPSNRAFTGPIQRFTQMMYAPSYAVMLDHKKHDILEVKLENNAAYFFIELTSAEGAMFGFKWTKDCTCPSCCRSSKASDSSSVGAGRRRSWRLCPGPEAASSKLMNENFCGARKVIHKNSAPLAPCLPPPPPLRCHSYHDPITNI